jgi:hypothetical protein
LKRFCKNISKPCFCCRLPAFFETVSQLSKRGRKFSIVIRTFGSDSAEVVEALHAWCEGAHPEAPNYLNLRAPTDDRIFRGRYAEPGGEFTLQSNSGEILSNEHDVVELLEGDADSCQFVVIQDHYKHWRKGNYHPRFVPTHTQAVKQSNQTTIVIIEIRL